MAALTTLAQYRMHDQMDGAWGWVMAAVMMIAVLAIVALVVWFVRSTSVISKRSSLASLRAHSSPAKPPPMMRICFMITPILETTRPELIFYD